MNDKVAIDAYTSYNQGVQLASAGLVQDAIKAYRHAIDKKFDIPQAHNNLGNLLGNSINKREALYHFREAVRLADIQNDTSTSAAASNNIGFMLQKIAGKDYYYILEAIKYFDFALKKVPNHLDAMYNKGSALKRLGNLVEADKVLSKVLEADPMHVSAHIDKGALYFELGDIMKALFHTDEAIKYAGSLRDQLAALNNKGQFLKDAGFIPQALKAYEKALLLAPEQAISNVNVVAARRQLCKWQDFRKLIHQVIKTAEKQIDSKLVPSLTPYEATLLKKSANWQFKLAKAVTSEWNSMPKLELQEAPNAKRIRIGYLSYDFRNHPMGYLMIGLLEKHQRSPYFSIYAYSYGLDDQSEIRQRAILSADMFIDLRNFSDIDASKKIRDDSITILVDMMAHTRGARIGITALQPSSIIVNYLGYPGTMGSDFTSYIILDRTVIPVEFAQATTEKRVYLPFSYQVNSYDLNIASCIDKNCQLEGRIQYSLPYEKASIIFCNFNTINKMEPESFFLWLSILMQVPLSVLWLLEPPPPLNNSVIPHLHQQAQAFGISPERIIFARRLPKNAHLERMRVADIFLDSLIYNAHSTCSDALWSLLPVVTFEGEAFPSRVASSLLRNVGMSSLITYSLKDYAKLAVHLARSPLLLGSIRKKLAFQNLIYPLFQTNRITKDLERAYEMMHELTAAHTANLIVNPLAPIFQENSTREFYQNHLADALRFHQLNNYEQARNKYERLLVISKENSDIWHLLGLALHQLNQSLKAVPYLQHAILLQPNISFYHSNLAHVYCHIGFINLAQNEFQEALRLDPFNIGLLESLTSMLNKHKKYITIIQMHEHYSNQVLIKSSTEQRENHILLHSATLVKAKFLLEVIYYLKGVISEMPLFFRASYNLAAAYHLLGKFKLSADTFFRTVKAENQKEYNDRGKYLKKILRPKNTLVVAIYCHEYGQNWWKTWGPSSAQKSGLGGSEEMVIFLASELQKLGYYVEIYGNPSDADIGLRDGVAWYPYYAYDYRSNPADIFIAWRYDISIAVGENSNYRFLWLHDLASIDTLTMELTQLFHRVICATHFHRSQLPLYLQKKTIVISNALDPKFFRDGNNSENIFIYGSAPNRGLETLLLAWPEIKLEIPTAILRVYYGFTDAFIEFGMKNIQDFDSWKAKMDILLKQQGVEYIGMVDHDTLAEGYAAAGFFLYPTTYPETGCISLLKAMALGAIPITSRYSFSALPELSGDFDLGPRPLNSSLQNDFEWISLWIESIKNAVSLDLQNHRKQMKLWSRNTFSIRRIALFWHQEFIDKTQSKKELKSDFNSKVL